MQEKQILELEAKLELSEAERLAMRQELQTIAYAEKNRTVRISRAHAHDQEFQPQLEQESEGYPEELPSQDSSWQESSSQKSYAHSRRPFLRLIGPPQAPASMEKEMAALYTGETLPVVPLKDQGIASTPALSEDAPVTTYRKALGLFKSRNYAGAKTAFETFVKTYPQHPYAINAQYWQAEASYALAHYAAALNEWKQFVVNHPRTLKTPDALWKMALCHEKLGQKAQALNMLERLHKHFPQSVAARLAQNNRAL